MSRTATRSRQTKETTISCTVNLDGTGASSIQTGVGFLDHMITALARHGRLDITLTCAGDLHIDDHHTAEDCALTLGATILDALGDRRGIARFGYAYAPLDEALARAVVDLSGRPWPIVELGFTREMLGGIATENLTHFLNSLAIAGRMNLHVDVIRGDNDHHKVEAAFKAVAQALRAAVRQDAADDRVPSTKGVLE
ncbi:MAG: imidazoleglycerol-phosphate dehydratase HisB [Myxococcota bacterium]